MWYQNGFALLKIVVLRLLRGIPICERLSMNSDCELCRAAPKVEIVNCETIEVSAMAR